MKRPIQHMCFSMGWKNTTPLQRKLPTRPKAPHTHLVSLSMVCTWTSPWVWERTASCWAHFKQRPPTRLGTFAARRDSLCFSRSLRSSQVFWYSAKSFLRRRGEVPVNAYVSAVWWLLLFLPGVDLMACFTYGTLVSLTAARDSRWTRSVRVILTDTLNKRPQIY